MMTTPDFQWFTVGTYLKLIYDRIETYASIHRRALADGNTDLAERTLSAITDAVDSITETLHKISTLIADITDEDEPNE